MVSKRLDSLGVEVEVGDIVFSAPKHKFSGKPEVGKVTGVFDSGRVTIQIPEKRSVRACERGAPDVEVEGVRWVADTTAPRDAWGRYRQKRESYTYMSKDYRVVGHEWKWVRKQAADITLVVLRKGDKSMSDLESLTNHNILTQGLSLDYDTERPELD